MTWSYDFFQLRSTELKSFDATHRLLPVLFFFLNFLLTNLNNFFQKIVFLVFFFFFFFFFFMRGLCPGSLKPTEDDTSVERDPTTGTDRLKLGARLQPLQ